MICSLCAAENPNNGRYCLKCGALLQGQRAMPPQSFESAPSAPYSGPTETSGKAIASMICGFLFFLFPIPILAVVLGHLSLADMRRSGGRITGRGMAVTGLVLGYAGVSVIPILIVAAIAIPNLLRSRTAANEASAVGAVRRIVVAEVSFNDSYANGYSPTLAALGKSDSSQDTCDRAGLIDKVLSSGTKNGYRFTYIATGDMVFSEGARARGCTQPGTSTFELHADPIERGSTGQRSFFVDQTGMIRFNLRGPATGTSPPLQRF